MPPTSHQPTPSIAEARGVTKHFRGLVALDGISIAIRAEEIVGLIGPNGSGKTTLLNILSGVLRPTSGSVELAGVSARRWTPSRVAAHGVGRTFQQIRLFNEMTVADNVAVGAVARGCSRAPSRLLALLRRVALVEHADRPAGTLSYGQQRRLEIARALAGEPRVLLLDEPAAGMNETESDELLATIDAIRDHDGCAVLVVDHDLRLIMRLCDRIHVIAEGRTIGEGPPDAMQRDPAVIAAYLGTTNPSGDAPDTNPWRGNT